MKTHLRYVNDTIACGRDSAKKWSYCPTEVTCMACRCDTGRGDANMDDWKKRAVDVGEALEHLRRILDAPGIGRLPDWFGAVGLNMPGETVMLSYGDLRAIRAALDFMDELQARRDAGKFSGGA